jgi:hypothetical protein
MEEELFLVQIVHPESIPAGPDTGSDKNYFL